MSSQLSNAVRSKFRGTLIAGLIGDCLGSPFEGEATVGRAFLANYLRKLLVESTRLPQIYAYTDDTAMMKSVAETFINCGQFNAEDLARRFTEEFFRAQNRGYGSAVKDTFMALRETEYVDPFEPAKHQFRGQGSLGNGAAMRVSPIALVGFRLAEDEVVELARNQSLITHAHSYGYNGAILQCLAVHHALQLSSKENGKQFTPDEFEAEKYLEGLITKMQLIEESSPSVSSSFRSGDRIRTNRFIDDSQTPFTDALKKIKSVLADQRATQGTDLSPEEIVITFGNSVSALKSVPTAIYSVLRAHRPIEHFETDDLLVRTLYSALSIGGDTDTIATMACSIVGALYGEEAIKNVLISHCEFEKGVKQLADDLIFLVENKK